MPRPFEDYLRGDALVGDDLDARGLAEWYQDEENAFFALYGGEATGESYPFHLVNTEYGYRHLDGISRFNSVLSFGGGFGDELLPIRERVASIAIVESGGDYDASSLDSSVRRVKAEPSGSLPFGNEEFDLVTCFSVLHHIPNVTHVFGELVRCLAPGGTLLLREPTHSMGDWRTDRPGLTPRERGIPLPFLENLIAQHQLEAVARTRFFFMGTDLAARILRLRRTLADSRFFALDRGLSRLFAWRYFYHVDALWKKFQPVAVFYVLRKPGGELPTG